MIRRNVYKLTFYCFREVQIQNDDGMKFISINGTAIPPSTHIKYENVKSDYCYWAWFIKLMDLYPGLVACFYAIYSISNSI